jgi:hypothetical protein
MWTAIQKGSGLVVDERTDLSRGAHDDVIVTDGRKGGEMITKFVNIYAQWHTQSGARQAQNVNWQSVIRQGRTVLEGGFNAHRSRWDPRCRAQRNTAFWEWVIDENGL